MGRVGPARLLRILPACDFDLVERFESLAAEGVAVTQSNLVNAYRAWERDYALSETTSHLQMASFSFDEV